MCSSLMRGRVPTGNPYFQWKKEGIVWGRIDVYLIHLTNHPHFVRRLTIWDYRISNSIGDTFTFLISETICNNIQFVYGPDLALLSFSSSPQQYKKKVQNRNKEREGKTCFSHSRKRENPESAPAGPRVYIILDTSKLYNVCLAPKHLNISFGSLLRNNKKKETSRIRGLQGFPRRGRGMGKQGHNIR